MPRVAIQLAQGAGKPDFDAAVAVTKASPAAYVTAALGGTVATTVFNITSYGASTGATDNTAAVQAAYNAARTNSRNGAHSTVFFPPGSYAMVTPLLLAPIRTSDYYGAASPVVAQAGTIKLSGAGATIRLTGGYGFIRAASGGVWTAPAQSTYGNLDIDGFTIDNMNRASISGATVLTMSGTGNADQVIVQNITVPDRFVHRTSAQQEPRANGIYIAMNPTSRTQAYTNYVTNITVRDSSIYAAGKPVAILSNSDGMSTFGLNPCVYDNILVDGVYANTCHYYASSIHIGSFGSGYRCEVRNCTCEDSCDDGIEINAFNEVLVENCVSNLCRQPICFVWFSYPFKTDTPTYTVRGCSYTGDCNSYWLDTVNAAEPEHRSPMMPEVRAGSISGEGNASDVWGRSWGNFVIEDCTVNIKNDYTTFRSAFTIGSSGPPLESVSITNCDITDAGPSGDPIYIRQGTSLGHTLPVTINDVRYRTSTGGSYALLTSGQVTLVNPTAMTVTTDISGL